VSAPEVRITAGIPTPDEEAAVRASIERIWREDRIAEAAGKSPWVAAARLQATRVSDLPPPAPGAWRRAAGIDRTDRR
jgi:hypothetical protein